MGFIANLFRKSSDIDFLEREKVLLEAEVAKYKMLSDLNAKQVIAERNRRDRDGKAFFQVTTKLAGGDHRLFNEPKELEEPKPEPLSEKQREGVRSLAQQMLDNDVQNNDMPLTIEEYEHLILAKPDEYLPIIVE